MANKILQLVLDLDTKTFIEKANNAGSVLKDLGDTESPSQLLQVFKDYAPAMAAITTVALSAKKALDWTLEAEELKKIEKQFDAITESVGIFGDDMKEAMLKASKGLVDDTELMKSATQAVISLGDRSNRIPEIMELATKATAVYGGTAIDNFEKISQALAAGNVRALRSYGILIDQKKAVEDYARAQGVLTNELTESGKKAAIMDAAMAQMGSKLKGIEPETGTLGASFKKISIAIEQMGETAVLWFDSKFGDAIRSAIGYVAEFATKAQKAFNDAFGQGTNEKLKRLEASHSEHFTKLAELEAAHLEAKNSINNTYGDVFKRAEQKAFAERKANALALQIEEEKAQLEKYAREIDALKKHEEDKRAAVEANVPSKEESPSIDVDARVKNELSNQQAIIALRKQEIDEKIRFGADEEAAEQLFRDRRLLAEQELAMQMQAIAQSQTLTNENKISQIEALQGAHNSRMANLETELNAERSKVSQAYANKSQGLFQGMGRQWAATMKDMNKDQQTMSQVGQKLMGGMINSAVGGFAAMGDKIEEMARKGKMSFAELGKAMLASVLSSLGTQAISIGSMKILEGIFPPNPALLGSGAALIGLGGALKAAAGGLGGGSSPSVPTPSASAGGGPDLTSDTYSERRDRATQDITRPDVTEVVDTRKQRQVVLNVQGNYFETEGTRRQLMEMMRQETDATGFTYTGVGGSYGA